MSDRVANEVAEEAAQVAEGDTVAGPGAEPTPAADSMADLMLGGEAGESDLDFDGMFEESGSESPAEEEAGSEDRQAPHEALEREVADDAPADDADPVDTQDDHDDSATTESEEPDALLDEIQDAVAAAIEDAAEGVGDDHGEAEAGARADEAMAQAAASLEGGQASDASGADLHTEEHADDDAEVGETTDSAATHDSTDMSDEALDRANDDAATTPDSSRQAKAVASSEPAADAAAETPGATTAEDNPTPRPADQKSPTSGQAPRSKAKALVARIRPVLVVVSARAGVVTSAGLDRVAAAFEGQPKVIRQSLAWVAIWTLFNAAVVWGFLVLFRTGGHSTPPETGTQIRTVLPDEQSRPAD